VGSVGNSWLQVGEGGEINSSDLNGGENQGRDNQFSGVGQNSSTQCN